MKVLSKEQYSYSHKDLILSTFRKRSISLTFKIILGITSGKTAISAQQLLIIIIDYYLMTRKVVKENICDVLNPVEPQKINVSVEGRLHLSFVIFLL